MIAYLGLVSQLFSTSEPEIEGANKQKKLLLRLIRKVTDNQGVYNKFSLVILLSSTIISHIGKGKAEIKNNG